MRSMRRIVAATAAMLVTAAGVVLTQPPQAAAAVAAPKTISTSPYHLSANYTKYNSLYSALAAKLPNAYVHTVMNDANHSRTAMQNLSLPGLETGFRFDSADNSDCRSYPQGISTSRDAVGGAGSGNYDGHQLVMVSWYTKTSCGGSGARSRITLVDWDATYANKYRKILLVEPTGTAAKPSFKDVNVHAGGIVWYGNYLYVADTSHGLRVFDMRKILVTSTTGSESLIGRQSDGKTYKAHNYKYVLPQIGTITDTSSSDLLWSTISLDRASKSLVVSEYTCVSNTPSGACKSAPTRAAKAVRFPFASGSTAFAATTKASQALQTPYFYVNGVASHNGRWWFNSSHYKLLYYWAPGKAASSYNWVSYGESISYWEDSKNPDLLWSLQEGAGNRNVFAVRQASYDG